MIKQFNKVEPLFSRGLLYPLEAKIHNDGWWLVLNEGVRLHTVEQAIALRNWLNKALNENT